MGVVVTPAVDPVTDDCAELWADPAVLAADMAIDPGDATHAIYEATSALKNLTAQVFHGPQCVEEDYLLAPGQRELELRRPVDVVHAVYSLGGDCSDELSEVEHCHLGMNTVRVGGADFVGPESLTILGRGACGSRSRRVRVIYRTTNTVPPGADRVAARLAKEYVLACKGDKSCKLPERITSVTRQGVSWTLLDPQEFLDKGLVGIGPIDHWLTIVAAIHRGLGVRNPLRAGVLQRSVVYDCGADCGDES